MEYHAKGLVKKLSDGKKAVKIDILKGHRKIYSTPPSTTLNEALISIDKFLRNSTIDVTALKSFSVKAEGVKDALLLGELEIMKKTLGFFNNSLNKK